MEELWGEGEGEGEGSDSRTGSRRSPFRCLPISSADFGTADAAAVQAPSYNCYHPYPFSASPSSTSHLQARPPAPEPSQGDAAEEIKAKIMSHPKYSDLLAAFVDCQKVGAPPEVAASLSAMARQLALDLASCCSHTPPPPPDPELDQFMELYCYVLIKFREDLTRPLQEAKDFLNDIESQLNLLPNDLDLLSGVGSSDKDEDCDSGGEANPRDKELKQHLLKKYGSYLSGLRQELSKKKKRGKLPKDARRKLLNWWELHYKWPYPSEMEKVALAESTGLDQKQINNWFINQRKRHWKPSEDMQLFVMDGYHPQTAAGGLFSIDGTSSFSLTQ